MREVSRYYANVGARLRYARTAIGISRAALGKLLGVSAQTVYNIEGGKVKISLDKARTAAEAMGCSVDWLCGATNHLVLNGYSHSSGKWFSMEADLEPFGLDAEPSL